jgi:hypothetical protein
MTDWKDEYEVDDDGRLRKKKRIMRSGDHIHFSMLMQDGGTLVARHGGAPLVVDSGGFAGGHRPGFLHSNDVLAVASSQKAAMAWEERKKRMSSAWRKKKGKVYGMPGAQQPLGDEQDDDAEENPPPRTTDTTRLRALADQAWEDRKVRMSNAWRR